MAPWWGENSKEAYASGLADLATALENWNASRTGRRAGRRVGSPRFKTTRHRWSCRFTTGSFGLTSADRRHVRLPRIGTVRTHESTRAQITDHEAQIGTVRTHESTRKLARHLERGTARVRSATVSWQHGRWQVSFSVEITRRQPVAPSRGGVVGVDLGVKHLAVLSTGETIANPQHVERAQRELRRWQRTAARRHGPDTRTRRKASHRWRKAQVRIARLHATVANARADGLHKLSTRLVEQFGTVVVEDRHVARMLRNHRLARAVADVGMGELRRQLVYKSIWHGRLVVADRWYPSSKTCSDCGVTKAKLRLSERVFTCDACGLRLDRDLNAARNLARLVETVAGGASSPSCGAMENEPAGNPPKTTTPPGVPGSGYRHGKTPTTTAGANAA